MAEPGPSRAAPPIGERGFTLLELLVSLALFAIVSVIAYSGLQGVMTADTAAREQARRLARLQTLYHFVARDLRQATDRPVRDVFGDRLPALDGREDALELTRAGRRNPAGLPRSRLERIAYRLEDGRLYRLAWNVLDRAQDSQPRRHVLLEPVDALALRYLDDEGRWRNDWTGPTASDPRTADLPRAIEFVVTLDGWGRLRWLFDLPRPVLPAGKDADGRS